MISAGGVVEHRHVRRSPPVRLAPHHPGVLGRERPRHLEDAFVPAQLAVQLALLDEPRRGTRLRATTTSCVGQRQEKEEVISETQRQPRRERRRVLPLESMKRHLVVADEPADELALRE